jgi:hypothetical protein
MTDRISAMEERFAKGMAETKEMSDNHDAAIKDLQASSNESEKASKTQEGIITTLNATLKEVVEREGGHRDLQTVERRLDVLELIPKDSGPRESPAMKLERKARDKTLASLPAMWALLLPGRRGFAFPLDTTASTPEVWTALRAYANTSVYISKEMVSHLRGERPFALEEYVGGNGRLGADYGPAMQSDAEQIHPRTIHEQFERLEEVVSFFTTLGLPPTASVAAREGPLLRPIREMTRQLRTFYANSVAGREDLMTNRALQRKFRDSVLQAVGRDFGTFFQEQMAAVVGFRATTTMLTVETPGNLATGLPCQYAVTAAKPAELRLTAIRAALQGDDLCPLLQMVGKAHEEGSGGSQRRPREETPSGGASSAKRQRVGEKDGLGGGSLRRSPPICYAWQDYHRPQVGKPQGSGCKNTHCRYRHANDSSVRPPNEGGPLNSDEKVVWKAADPRKTTEVSTDK